MAIKQIKDINRERKINTPPTPTETQKLDDQTPIDDANRQRKLSGLQGFDKRIPAGEEKTIKVLKLRIGQGNPIIIKDSDNELIGTYDEIKIEGESSLVHIVEEIGCEKRGSLICKTNASILVRKKK